MAEYSRKDFLLGRLGIFGAIFFAPKMLNVRLLIRPANYLLGFEH